MSNNNKKNYRNFTEIDFEANRESLKAFMRARPEFTDYDFDGSVLSFLMDVLSYNTQYAAFYGNMLASERWSQYAQRRKSIVDNARDNGYVTRSARASSARISFDIESINTTDNNDTLLIPSGTKFTGRGPNGETYTFRTDYPTYAALNENGLTYHVNELEIYEGKSLSYRARVSGDSNNVFTIPNKSVDTSRMSVVVYESESDVTGEVYTLSDDITTLTSNDRAYFIQEGADEKFQIYFGDGVLSKALSPGNIVEIEYVKVNGSLTNGIRQFTLNDTIGGTNNRVTNMTTDVVSFGGDEIEGVESVRLRSPANFRKQNRSVLAIDFLDSVKSIYSNTRGVNAWGGEENIPPRYGSVYASIIPEKGYILSDAVREDIQNQLKSRFTMLGINPVIVNPSYTYIVPSVTVSYDSTMSSESVSEIRSAVTESINAYRESTLSLFNSAFRFSKLSAAIDSSSINVISNSTDITCYIEIISIAGLKEQGSLLFNTSLSSRDAIESSSFSYRKTPGAKLVRRTGSNVIDIVESDSGTIIQERVATVDHESGTIEFDFNRLTIEDISLDLGQRIRVYATPGNDDITPARNQVLSIKPADISVKVRDIISGSVT